MSEDTADRAADTEMTQQQRKQKLIRSLADFDAGLEMLESDPQAARRKLRAAAEGFQAIIDSGIHNGQLYYNLGNAYMQLGELGKAIANYRRAAELIPGDPRLESNLQEALDQRRNQIEPAGGKTLLQTIFFWHYRTPLRMRFVVALVAYVAFWLVMIVRMYVRRLRLGLVAGVLALLWLTLGASVAFERLVEKDAARGVIVQNQVVVRKGNGENYDPKFEELLGEGVEFTVLERRGDWLRIELLDGNTGWIRSEQAELI